MSMYEREQSYIEYLTQKDHTVKELAGKLFISEPTVRRDIVRLSEKGLVNCKRGVVKLNISSPDSRIPLFLRETEETKAKSEMALQAAAHIKDGYTIMLDASTSAYSIIPHLTRFKKIFVITSGLKAALALTTLGINCLCTGGEIIKESFSYVGTDAEQTLRRYNADIAFFSCYGLDQNGMASDTSILENSIRRIMIANSKQKYLLCDKTKFGRTCLNTLCYKNELDGIISD